MTSAPEISMLRGGGLRSANVRKVVGALPTAECLPWPGKLDEQGYGRIDSAITTLAHRYVYLLMNGPITLPEIDHTCQNRACCNPVHLEQVDVPEHAQRRVENHTVCRNGHTYTETNTYWCRGVRQCRECRRNQDRKRQPRRRRANPKEN